MHGVEFPIVLVILFFRNFFWEILRYKAGSALIPLKFCFIPNHDNQPFCSLLFFQKKKSGKPHFISRIDLIFIQKVITNNWKFYPTLCSDRSGSSSSSFGNCTRLSLITHVGRVIFLFFLCFVFFDYGEKDGNKKNQFFFVRRWCDVAISGGGSDTTRHLVAH